MSTPEPEYIEPDDGQDTEGNERPERDKHPDDEPADEPGDGPPW